MKKRGRPGGNPEITKYSFQRVTGLDESCTEKTTIRFPYSWRDKMPEGWQQACRMTQQQLINNERNVTERYNWDEGLDHRETLRYPPSWKDKLPKGWAEECRKVVSDMLS